MNKYVRFPEDGEDSFRQLEKKGANDAGCTVIFAMPQNTQEGRPADCELDQSRPVVQGSVHNVP